MKALVPLQAHNIETRSLSYVFDFICCFSFCFDSLIYIAIIACNPLVLLYP